MTDRNTVIAFAGAPGAGKTYLLARVYHDLLARRCSFFLQPGCPDGEGVWTSESPEGKALARRAKRKFTPEFVEWVITSVRRLRGFFSIVLVDLGGIPSSENERILGEVDAVVFVGEESPEWKALLDRLGLERIYFPARSGDDVAARSRLVNRLLQKQEATR